MPDHRKQIFGLALLVVGIAFCCFGLSQLLKPTQYAATVRIQTELESEIESEFVNPGSDVSYDPYFIQTEFEVLQSQLVLGLVITNLNLNEVWGRKYFGGKMLKTTETMAIIKNRMSLAPVRNSKLIAITFYSDNPNEAAQVANAIAKAYHDYRNHRYKELMKVGFEVLQQEFQEQAKQISVQQTNVEQLRRKFGIQDTAATNLLPEQQPYWDEKRNLEQMIKFHQLLGSKLEPGKMDLQIPFASMVQIINIAEPPKSPVSPGRFLGAELLALGLVLSVAGWLLLKS